MKKVLMGAGALFGSLVLLGNQASAENVYIPDKSVRDEVTNMLINPLERPVSNSLPTVEDMLSFNLDFSINFNPERSIEGLQYATNLENISINTTLGILDYRPISGMKNLKSFYSYSLFGSSLYEKVIDIEPFGELNDLESLNLGGANVTDLTPLENLTNLKFYYSAGSNVKLPKTYVSKESKTFIIESPVKYSSQFTNITVDGTANDTSEKLDCTISDNALIIKNLDINTKELKIYMTGESENFDWDKGFQSTMTFTIPIGWY